MFVFLASYHVPKTLIKCNLIKPKPKQIITNLIFKENMEGVGFFTLRQGCRYMSVQITTAQGHNSKT